ncbi:hypothetical protein PR048_006507 [Dryococelus australis]|uniref:Uncharacterized protein n=1 Tax=Dryococelus australis TaxID=614101 RepID=A0ABQ9IB79_9NEOP|nr:hypothetical protein PR048_006507 [Dryococelus australis]
MHSSSVTMSSYLNRPLNHQEPRGVNSSVSTTSISEAACSTPASCPIVHSNVVMQYRAQRGIFRYHSDVKRAVALWLLHDANIYSFNSQLGISNLFAKMFPDKCHCPRNTA